MTVYLNKEEVLLMHKDLIDDFGGAHGLINEGLLEAALYSPQSGYYKDLLEKAAALLESLAWMKLFAEGNFNFEHLLIWIRAQSQALAKTISEN